MTTFANLIFGQVDHADKVPWEGIHSRRFPTLWDTDEDQYVIRGYVLDAVTQAQVGDVPAGEGVIRVPKALMRHLPEDHRQHGADQ